VYHLYFGDILRHPRDLESVLLPLRQVVYRVLQFTLVAMAPRSDGLPGDISHSITDRCSEGRPLVSTEDPRSGEDLYNCLEFHLPWMWNSLDSVSWGGGDAQVSQQGTKPAGRDWGFSTEGFPLVSISVQLLTLVVTRGRVLFTIFIFSVNVVVLLLLLLLSRCSLSCLATPYDRLNLKRLLLLRCMWW
jgi:hypothetical protein